MTFEAMFFDLDDTLYPATSGVWQAIGKRMDLYMTAVLGFDPDMVATLRANLFHKYGTTLRGLKLEYNIDEIAFLDFVHDIPLEKYLYPNHELAEILKMYSDRKIIFTNANQDHARRVVSILGLEGIFEQVIDILQISPSCKPFPDAFSKALAIAQINNPQDCVLIDDSPGNIETASQFGMLSIQVGTHTRSQSADANVLSLLDLPNVIPIDIGELKGAI